MVRECRPDVVLMDGNMAGVNGFEALQVNLVNSAPVALDEERRRVLPVIAALGP